MDDSDWLCDLKRWLSCLKIFPEKDEIGNRPYIHLLEPLLGRLSRCFLLAYVSRATKATAWPGQTIGIRGYRRGRFSSFRFTK